MFEHIHFRRSIWSEQCSTLLLLKLRISHCANVSMRCKGFQGVNAQRPRYRKLGIVNEEPQVRDSPSVVSHWTMPLVLIPAMDEVYQPWMKLYIIHVPATKLAHISVSIHPPWGPAHVTSCLHPSNIGHQCEACPLKWNMHSFQRCHHSIFDGKGIKDRWRSSACYLNSEACVNPTNKLVWLCNLPAIRELQAGSTTSFGYR